MQNVAGDGTRLDDDGSLPATNTEWLDLLMMTSYVSGVVTVLATVVDGVCFSFLALTPWSKQPTITKVVLRLNYTIGIVPNVIIGLYRLLSLYLATFWVRGFFMRPVGHERCWRGGFGCEKFWCLLTCFYLKTFWHKTISGRVKPLAQKVLIKTSNNHCHRCNAFLILVSLKSWTCFTA